MANNMILVNGYNFYGENMSNFSETISSESSVTYVSENPPIQIKIVGLINTICFQRAKRYALVMARHLPTGYAPPEIIPYFEVEWNEYLLRHKRLYGGHYYKVKKPLIVYKDNEYLGDDEDLINYLQQFYQISVLEDFEAKAVRHMKQYIEKNDRTYICMLISIDDVCFGTLVFCLYNDICPNTCANFLRLSTLKRRGYAGAPVHRICRNSWVQFGGWKLKRSSEPLACENYAVPHDRRGVLSMCHNGKHRDNSTQFFVSLNPTPWMNYLYCAFGQLVIGDEILTKISNVETCDECPLSNITICQSGLYSFYEVITPENEKLLKTLYKAKIRGSSGSMTPPDKVDSATKTDLDRALKTPPERRDTTLKKDLDDELKQIVDPVYRLPQTPYRLEDELLFRPYNEVLLGSKAKVLKHKIKGSDKVVTAEGVVRPIVKTLLKKVVPKKIISKAPQSVLDSRDVPSNFSISKFNNGMYDFIETLL